MPRDLGNSLQKGLLLFCLLILGCLTAVWAFRLEALNLSSSGRSGNAVIIEAGEGFERPGLYPYSKAPKISEVVRDAGGLTSGLPVPIPVGEIRIEKDITLKFVPGPEEKAAFEEGPLSNRALWILGRPLPLNRVSEQDLDRLPGVGPVMASRIVEYRNNRGGFSSLEELKQVNGIKEKTFEKIKAYFYLP